MNAKTQAQLHQINHHFYVHQAKGFGQTRQHPWPGWYPLLPLLTQDVSISVLDLGCGNGRFGQFLHDQGYMLQYTGVDTSSKLLSQAQSLLSSKIETNLIQADVCEWLKHEKSPVASFDLVVAFGLLHHLPGSVMRTQFLSEALKHTHQVLAVSFWQFALFPRFSQLIIPWHEYNQHLPKPIDIKQLELNDFLLSFAGQKIPRYCHSFSDAEIQQLDQFMPYPNSLSYQADGNERYNRYVVWQPSYHANIKSCRSKDASSIPDCLTKEVSATDPW